MPCPSLKLSLVFKNSSVEIIIVACYKLQGILSLEALLQELLQRVLTVPVLQMPLAKTKVLQLPLHQTYMQPCETYTMKGSRCKTNSIASSDSEVEQAMR